LDNKFHSTPWLTLLGVILAIASTTVWLTRRLKEFIK
jgi:LPXTG-motif cell wall-anchored protein